MRRLDLAIRLAARSLALSFVALFLLSVCANSAGAQTKVDLELVLAVDVSLSMDLDEQRLQREGYVAALRDPEIHKAITSGPHGRIAVTYVEWAGTMSQAVVMPWTILDSPAAAEAFASKLEQMPISRARFTSISAALSFSRDLFASSGAAGIRRVIDVSGDGPNNAGFPVQPIRDEVVAAGIVINGLPIMLKAPTSSMFDIANLDDYYASCVIGGTGSFLVPVRDLGEFKLAIRRKLLLEISGLMPPGRIIPVQNTQDDGFDCLAGEKLWRGFYMPERGPN